MGQTIALDRKVFIATAGAPTVTPQGTPGATAYSYKVVAKGSGGQVAAASAAGSTASGAAALNGTDFNRVTWSAVPGVSGYDVYRTVGGATQGLIGSVGSGTTQYDDDGDAGDSASAPATGTSGVGDTLDVRTRKLRGKKVIAVTGTFVATVTIEGRIDGRTWARLGSTTVRRVLPVPNRIQELRVKETAYTSGTPVVTLVAARR